MNPAHAVYMEGPGTPQVLSIITGNSPLPPALLSVAPKSKSKQTKQKTHKVSKIEEESNVKGWILKGASVTWVSQSATGPAAGPCPHFLPLLLNLLSLHPGAVAMLWDPQEERHQRERMELRNFQKGETHRRLAEAKQLHIFGLLLSADPGPQGYQAPSHYLLYPICPVPTPVPLYRLNSNE